MKAETFVNLLGADFFTGVPDSQLKALCDYLISTYGLSAKHHIIAANEGNCAAIAAGYHLATGRVPVVYMQNSGEGNIINPVASLLNKNVYGIPAIFVIGWRGEPGVHDEPQHAYQGKITCRLLDDLEIPFFVIANDTEDDEVRSVFETRLRPVLSEGRQIGFVVRKAGLTYDGKVSYHNDRILLREEIIKHITTISGDDPIISTTGKASRELFEIRSESGETHSRDFLTVGSMGHSSSIALGIAVNVPTKKVWCIDGDGAVLMHMGALPVIASCHPKNFVHVVINNGAHESVGGQPTVMGSISVARIALDCGYDSAVTVYDVSSLDLELKKAKEKGGLFLIEVKAAIGARNDLGRPTISPVDNKTAFMGGLQGDI